MNVEGTADELRVELEARFEKAGEATGRDGEPSASGISQNRRRVIQDALQTDSELAIGLARKCDGLLKPRMLAEVGSQTGTLGLLEEARKEALALELTTTQQNKLLRQIAGFAESVDHGFAEVTASLIKSPRTRATTFIDLAELRQDVGLLDKANGILVGHPRCEYTSRGYSCDFEAVRAVSVATDTDAVFAADLVDIYVDRKMLPSDPDKLLDVLGSELISAIAKHRKYSEEQIRSLIDQAETASRIDFLSEAVIGISKVTDARAKENLCYRAADALATIGGLGRDRSKVAGSRANR